jgi:hypothetical protein
MHMQKLLDIIFRRITRRRNSASARVLRIDDKMCCFDRDAALAAKASITNEAALWRY